MLKKMIEIYDSIEDIITCFSMVIGIGVMFIGVVARYVFNSPLTFVDEVGPIFLAWSSLIGYSVALRNDELTIMDLFYNTVYTSKFKHALIICSYFCGLLFTLFMLVYGYKTMLLQYKMHRATPILGIPVWSYYLVIPFSGAIMSLRYIVMIFNFFHKTEKEG